MVYVRGLPEDSAFLREVRRPHEEAQRKKEEFEERHQKKLESLGSPQSA